MPTTPIKQFGPIQSLTESTEVGISLTRATNILLRPNRGFRGIPLYYRLFGIGNSTSVQDTLRALTYNDTAIGGTDDHRSTNKTVAIQVACQAKNFLLFYDLTATSKPCRGWFYLGDKGSAPASLDLNSGTVVYTVLAVGLDAAARWYGTRAYSEWLLGNGIDENVIVQLNRTATPGVWRKAASNAKPAAPVITAVAPSNTGLTQASWTIDTRLKLSANSDNYPGVSGNDRIRVTVTPTVAALTSVLTGAGTPTTDPFNYAITGGITMVSGSSVYPLASSLKDYINADTKILTVLQALLTGSDAPVTSTKGPTLLSGGAGSGTSEGFSARVATIIARYWDPGQEGLGYEGVSSDESNTITIPSDQNYDLRVALTPNASAENGRFPFIRIYLNYMGTNVTEFFSLMNPSDPIPNTPGSTGTLLSSNASTTLYSADASTQVSAVFSFGSANINVANISLYPIGSSIMFAAQASGFPAGITAWQTYYVVYSTGVMIRISAAPGGTPISFTTTTTASGYRPTAHGLAVDDVLVIDTTLAPSLLADGTYTIVAVPSTLSLRLAATVGGAPIAAVGFGSTNYTQARIVQLGTNSEVGQAMSEDQNRPLPHTHHVLANQQTWRAGVTYHQERLYASKLAPVDEPVPEGCYADDFTSVQSTSSAAGSAEITATYTDGQWLHLHTPAGILLVDPANPTATAREPQVGTGAINGASMVAMPDRRIFYIGSDLSLMAFDASIQLQEIVGNASVSSAAATSYIRSRVDTDAIAANNDRAHAYLDSVGQLLWLYLPGTTAVSNGELIGFAYDLLNGGIVGEFTFPRVYASAMMEKTRPEITFVDEDGNLLYTDPTNQPDHSDNFGSQAAFVTQATGTAIPTADNGFGNVIYDAGSGNLRYLRAYTSYLETGYWDLGNPASRKAFMAFCWRTIAGSKAIMIITLESLSGDPVTYTLGDVASYGCNHRAPLMMSDSAIKAKISILSGSQRSWAVRDCAFDWLPQAFASL